MDLQEIDVEKLDNLELIDIYNSVHEYLKNLQKETENFDEGDNDA